LVFEKGVLTVDQRYFVDAFAVVLLGVDHEAVLRKFEYDTNEGLNQLNRNLGQQFTQGGYLSQLGSHLQVQQTQHSENEQQHHGSDVRIAIGLNKRLQIAHLYHPEKLEHHCDHDLYFYVKLKHVAQHEQQRL